MMKSDDETMEQEEPGDLVDQAGPDEQQIQIGAEVLAEVERQLIVRAAATWQNAQTMLGLPDMTSRMRRELEDLFRQIAELRDPAHLAALLTAPGLLPITAAEVAKAEEAAELAKAQELRMAKRAALRERFNQECSVSDPVDPHQRRAIENRYRVWLTTTRQQALKNGWLDHVRADPRTLMDERTWQQSSEARTLLINLGLDE